MKVTIHFDHAGRPALGLVRGWDSETPPDFGEVGFPFLVVADDVDVEIV